MEQFNLEKYLENPSRKICTRNGRLVRIVCWDVKGLFPILALIMGNGERDTKVGEEYPCCYKVDGTCPVSNLYDLFFADKEKKLTDANGAQSDLLFQKMKEAGYEWDAEKKELKKIEQNSTDNVDPKFKVGDWIYHEKSGNTFHINRIENCTYISDEGATISFGRQDDWRNWTIQDAKDGDILTYYLNNGKVLIMIYECLGKSFDGHVNCHALLDRDYFSESAGSVCCKFMELLTPSTKEQCDLLFQKMRHSGYEWDAEKKELKKIEKQCEQIHAEWSEKDEENLNWVINVWNRLRRGGDAQTAPNQMEMLENWLKSIKDRVQPQSTSEWGDEDELNLNSFLHKLEVCDLLSNKEITWIKNKLKSIKPQQNQYDKGYEDGYSAAKYNQWKPTDKQMEDFRALLDYNIGVFDYAKFMSANSLYDDLKKKLID